MSVPPLVRLAGVDWVADPGLPRERKVLRDVHLEIAAGERVGLVGRSGAGKTTLVTILAGLLEPTHGAVWTAPGAPAVGLVFQEPERGFFEETVLEDVAFGPRNAGLADGPAREKAREALRRVGLDPERIGPRAPETLSGGEARRAAIAGVLAFEPGLVVFDEPTIGLDAEGVARLRAILDGLRERGVAYLLVSHEISLIAEECQRVLVLDEGRVVWNGEPARLHEGLPATWHDDPATWGGELVAVVAAMRGRGLIDDDPAPTPEGIAEAWLSRSAGGA